MWGRQWGCDNDVGQLRVVLMHRPGDEMNIIDPKKRIEEIGSYGDLEAGWYFQSDTIPELDDVQAQHDGLVKTLRDEVVEVVFLDTIEPDGIKSIYTRDSSFAIKGGAVVTRLARTIRRGEEAHVTKTLANLGMPILRTLNGNAMAEGGSFAMLNSKTAVIGRSICVNEEGSRQIEEVLNAQGVELIRVDLTGYSIHIDGALTMIDVDVAIIDATQLPYWFLEKLKELGIKTVEVTPQDSGWIINCLAVRPGRVIMPPVFRTGPWTNWPTSTSRPFKFPMTRSTTTAAASTARPVPWCAIASTETTIEEAAAMADVMLVTGASRGIGAATARLGARQGYDVLVNYVTDKSAADNVVAEVEAAGRRAVAVQADMGDPAQVSHLFRACDKSFGRLDAFVNNAGIVGPTARVDEIGIERLERMIAINLTGAFLACGEAVRRMSLCHGGTGGVIVNLSSAAARLGGAGEYVDYAATKGAIDSLTIGLSKEVADEGIRVNAVRPGLIHTDIHASGGRPDRVEQLAPGVPMQRGGTADEVAETILWLCSDASSYVTGSLIEVSGGR